jgi:hypothetical protein
VHVDALDVHRQGTLERFFEPESGRGRDDVDSSGSDPNLENGAVGLKVFPRPEWRAPVRVRRARPDGLTLRTPDPMMLIGHG